MRFGEYIHKLRMAKNLTLSNAARELGMTPQRLNDIEAGRRIYKRQPKIELLKKIAAVYDHPLSNLVENTEFFQYEKNVLLDLFVDITPVAASIEEKTLEMLIEAKQYTPEMERLASAAHQLSQDLKLALALAKRKLDKNSRSYKPPRENTLKAG